MYFLGHLQLRGNFDCCYFRLCRNGIYLLLYQDEVIWLIFCVQPQNCLPSYNFNMLQPYAILLCPHFWNLLFSGFIHIGVFWPLSTMVGCFCNILHHRPEDFKPYMRDHWWVMEFLTPGYKMYQILSLMSGSFHFLFLVFWSKSCLLIFLFFGHCDQKRKTK